MPFEEKRLQEDKEYEECMIKTPPMIVKESWSKYPAKLQRNRFWQKWRGTSRGSVADFLCGFVVRKRCDNPIANMIYTRYYQEKRLLVSRFTQQGLAERLGYKDRRGIQKQLKTCEQEKIFKIHWEPWGNRKIRIYEFGYWKKDVEDNYSEILHMYSKFNKILNEFDLQKNFD